MKQTLLRNFLMLDAAVLFLMGALLVLLPEQVEQTFAFRNLPTGVHYIIGLWGCALAALSIGYVVAARNPIRHIIWVQVGIARGAAEAVLGLVCVAQGIVTFRQAAFGIFVAGLMSLAYLILYPRKPRLLRGPENAALERKGA